MIIRFAKIREGARIPSKEEEDAGYDIYPCFEEDYIEIKPLNTVMIPTGIASALPDKYYFQIQERGSTGTKGMKYGAGVIDSGYRGEWFIPITNCNDKSIYIVKEDCDFDGIIYPYDKAIAQAILLEVPKVEIEELSYEELRAIPSKRGSGRLGSTGK
ncbi:MAG: hypothetical protein Q4P31_03505 [Andreesenia angusta]|nr:hypothetical protein [Andreesenia angusta]